MTYKQHTTRKSRWIVTGNGEFVSQHNSSFEAGESAANWSASNGGAIANIEPPAYEVYIDMGSVTVPEEEEVVVSSSSATPEEEEVVVSSSSAAPVVPPATGVMLTPGAGLPTPMPSLNIIGDVDEVAIANWNVVPERQLFGDFNAGVVAHHVDGIDHVAFSLDGGPWKLIKTPSINPRTNCEEYWATIPEGSGWRELRAVAVPTKGKPKTLPTTRLYAGENEELFREIVLEAGTHDGGQLMNSVGEHREGWVTIRAAEGVERNKVIIIGNMRTSRDMQLRFEGITRKLGQWDEHNGSKNWSVKWWFDNCRIEGNTRSRWIVHESGRQYYTDTEITDMQTTFSGATLLARNVVIERGWEDICRTFGMMVNVRINKLYQGEFSTYHADVFQWHGAVLSNFIAQDVSSPITRGQGLFTGDMQNSAFLRVNLDIDQQPNKFYYSLQMQGETKNVLLKDCGLSPGILRVDKGFSADRLVLDNVAIPQHANIPGVEIRN